VTPPPSIRVLRFSDAFGSFWTELATELQATIDSHSSRAVVALDPNSALLILAAGGAERDALQWLNEHDVPALMPCFVVTADSSRRVAMQFVRAGAADYFALPEDVEVLRNAVAAVLQRSTGATPPSGTRRVAPEHKTAFSAIVGESPELREQVARASRIARHRNASTLIVGETGTGKELFARAIHAASPRSNGPFVPVNCSALPDNLVESELFGHERGAFTGAHAAKPGLFEIADGGTLFLDEMSSLPLSLQAKLLRVLDDKQIRRVGGNKSHGVDVRVLAAANEDLEQRVRDGTFREDLFYRISGVTFHLPPLRDRGDDLLRIADALLARLAREHDLPVPLLTREVQELLSAHSWPGNVRELKNAVERALLMSPSGELHGAELVPRPRATSSKANPIPFPAPLAEINTAVARATVQMYGGNRAESARRLEISPRRLRRLLAGDDSEDASESPDA